MVYVVKMEYVIKIDWLKNDGDKWSGFRPTNLLHKNENLCLKIQI